MESGIDKWLRRILMLCSIAVMAVFGAVVGRHLLDNSYGDCFLNGMPSGRGWMPIAWEERHMVADSIGADVAEKDVVRDGVVCSSFDTKFVQLQQKRNVLWWRPKKPKR